MTSLRNCRFVLTVLLCFFSVVSFTQSHLSAQNVGIGTASPVQKLHVVGNARVDNALITQPTTLTPDGLGGVAGLVTLSMIVVDDDATAIANTLTLAGTPTAGQVLWLQNDDADQLSFDAYTVAGGEAGHFFYDGANWNEIGGGGASNAWELTGNAGTNATANFLGTTDAQDLVLRTNNAERFRIDAETGFIDLEQVLDNTIIGDQAGASLTPSGFQGRWNTFIGYRAGNTNTTASNNHFIGYNAGLNNTAPFNHFEGFQAGLNNTTGQFNHFSGYEAGFNATESEQNTLIGFQAGYTIGSIGDRNTFIGYQAGFSNTTADDGIFIGYEAGRSNAIGGANVFIGSAAGRANTNGSRNTFVGHRAGTDHTLGIDNTFIGYEAGENTTTGSRNVFLGYDAGEGNVTGSNNVFIGWDVGEDNTDGEDNVFIGREAGTNNTTGDDNVFIGRDAGFRNTTANDNTFIGYFSGNSTTTGGSNTFVGNESGQSNVNGARNTFLGFDAGENNIGGDDNVFIGWNAGEQNTEGNFNVYVGRNAGEASTDGDDNVFVGRDVGADNTTGSFNTFTGGFSGLRNTTGSSNTFIGHNAGRANTTGSNNVIIGQFAAVGNNYNRCVIIGDAADPSADLTNAIQIGQAAFIPTSDQVRIGNADITSIAGQVGFTTVSDARFKQDIQPDVPGLAFINRLQPVTYEMNTQRELEILYGHTEVADSIRTTLAEVWAGKRITGFIAQDVEAAAEAIGYSFSGIDYTRSEQFEGGGYYGLRYAEFVVPLVKSVQELSAQNATLTAENADLKAHLEKLESVVQTLAPSAFTEE